MMHEYVYDWLRAEAAQRRLNAVFHTEATREDAEWLYIPVFLQDVCDAYEKASILRSLEDTWDQQRPEPAWHLLLIPAAN